MFDRYIDRELSAIFEISRLLSSSLDLSKTLHGVLNVLSSYLNMRRPMVSLVQPDRELHVVGANELSPEELRRGRFRMGEGITGRILKSGTPMVVPDVSQEPLFLNRTGSREIKPGVKIAFCGVPIKIGREAIGVISADREAESGPPMFERDIRFLTMVANLIGQTIQLQQAIAADREQLLHDKHRLQKQLQGKYNLDNVIGNSARMQEVFAEVHQAAPGRATVLLRGESGTGKEVIARAIHQLSPRKNGPFVRVNCAALSETLLESELFGHEKGAFTGAVSERKGRFELADGGTLFLDEIGEISPTFQTKLLRVLQEREFERVGGARSIKVDVRLIAATNRHLEEMVTHQTFRADLYFRLNVVSIFLPPLRERSEDIAPLAQHFLDKFNAENRRELALSPEALKVMLICRWPGNVRELENCVERSATMTRGNAIREMDLPCQQGKCLSQSLQPFGTTAFPLPVVGEALHRHNDMQSGMPETERERILWAMERCGWVQAKAARLLELTPRQMGYALKKYRIPMKKL